MIIYRPHRGLLADAMREAQEFSSLDEMKRLISDETRYLTGEPLFLPEDICIGEEVFSDTRIGWEDCRHVCTRRMGDEMYPIPQCIGWCATKYKKAGE